MILHGNFFEIMLQWKKIKFKIFIYSLMELEMKITCTCHQAKITICCQTPLVTPIAPKICTRGFFNMLNPNLPSDLLSDHSSPWKTDTWWVQLNFTDFLGSQPMLVTLKSPSRPWKSSHGRTTPSSTNECMSKNVLRALRWERIAMLNGSAKCDKRTVRIWQAGAS